MDIAVVSRSGVPCESDDAGTHFEVRLWQGRSVYAVSVQHLDVFARSSGVECRVCIQPESLRRSAVRCRRIVRVSLGKCFRRKRIKWLFLFLLLLLLQLLQLGGRPDVPGTPFPPFLCASGRARR